MRYSLSILILTFLAGAALAEKQPFERYQSIVARQMFGPLPEGFDPTKLPTEVQKSTSAEEKALLKEQEKLQSAIHFSMINVTPDGKTAVGFTDSSDPKSPVNYYLKVGESRNGWTVKEADAQAATMTIARGEIEVSLTIGDNSAKGGGLTARAGMSGAAAGTSQNAGRRPFAGGGLGGSLRARREERAKARAAEAAKQAEAAAAERAQREAKEAEREAAEAAEKAQREQERAEQRQQLLAIQEELKRVREAKAAEKKAESDGGEEN